MSDEIIDRISKSFYLYHDLKEIENNIQKYKKAKKKVDNHTNYRNDFYNSLKLYYYLTKKELNKNDYIGIILEETNKDKDNELREYSIKKITDPQNE